MGHPVEESATPEIQTSPTEVEDVEKVIAKEMFVTNQITVVWLLLSTTVCLTYWLQKYRISKVLPPSIAAMVLGMFVSIVIRYVGLDPPKFSPTVFLYGLLPPIVFSAGFNMKKRSFFQNFGTIATFAVVGTVISTLVFSLFTLMLMAIGAVDRDKIGSDPGIKIFLYGSLISAIDPVATLSVFGDMDAPPLLYNLVFGESVLNDAVSIVLFRTFEGLLGQKIYWWTIFLVAAKFCWISLGSLAVGMVVSLICAAILKNFNPNGQDTGHSDGTVYEISIVFMTAYLAYLLAEVISLSGIVALFVSGIVHAHYSFHNISADAQIAICKVANVVAFICEIFVFEYLGMQVALISIQNIDPGIIVSGIPLCLLSRAANIFPLAYLVNRFRQFPIPRPVQMMQFLCGLRGAVAYALSAYLSEINPSRAIEVGTLVIAVISTILFGGGTGFAMRLLRLQGADDADVQRMNFADAAARGTRATSSQEGIEINAIESRWERLDNAYLKPYFGGRLPSSRTGGEDAALLSYASENMDSRESPAVSSRRS